MTAPIAVVCGDCTHWHPRGKGVLGTCAQTGKRRRYTTRCSAWKTLCYDCQHYRCDTEHSRWEGRTVMRCDQRDRGLSPSIADRGGLLSPTRIRLPDRAALPAEVADRCPRYETRGA